LSDLRGERVGAVGKYKGGPERNAEKVKWKTGVHQ